MGRVRPQSGLQQVAAQRLATTAASQAAAPPRSAAAWEALWAPYDAGTYESVLGQMRPADIVLDIGAGDLRLARQMARRAAHVYALEQQAGLVATQLGTLPDNLTLLVGDARRLAFPAEVTIAVLLMRHCRHFALYRQKLAETNCRTFMTNARWGMGVESIQLKQPPRPFQAVELGWYACRCGATGFKPGAPAALTAAVEAHTHEVASCPHCDGDLLLAHSPINTVREPQW